MFPKGPKRTSISTFKKTHKTNMTFPILPFRVLLPGGASYFNVTDGYAEAGMYIMEIANEFNMNGDFFPVWGTCLGFELIGYVANNNHEIREDCSSHNEAIPLRFKPDFACSKLFRNMPESLIQVLARENSTMNFHQYCITERGMEKNGLLRSWTIMSTNTDENGLEYVSTMEHKTMPYWGVQFHPEKPAYEWNPKHNTPHTFNTIRANQYFADFFVEQTRKNCHKFPSYEQERLYLIYNFPATYGKPQSTFTQLYFFD
ncbi:hypothetical protein RUM44_004903 [Polyplax serrata]|uniref:folate gamma-glutamyl hydrolase n=1 Tax=Polyplax serrata TaxID=468196 RepID=A0ABR1B467_POLSC